MFSSTDFALCFVSRLSGILHLQFLEASSSVGQGLSQLKAQDLSPLWHSIWDISEWESAPKWTWSKKNLNSGWISHLFWVVLNFYFVTLLLFNSHWQWMFLNNSFWPFTPSFWHSPWKRFGEGSEEAGWLSENPSARGDWCKQHWRREGVQTQVSGWRWPHPCWLQPSAQTPCCQGKRYHVMDKEALFGREVLRFKHFECLCCMVG